MKNLFLTLGFLIIVLLMGCSSFPEQALLAGAVGRGIQEAAVAQQFDIHVEKLNKQSSQELWRHFFQERGAKRFWRQLRKPATKLTFDFRKVEIKEAGIADELAAGIILYLVYHYQEVKTLALTGRLNSRYRRITRLPAAIGQLQSLQDLILWYNQLSTLPATIAQLKSLQWLDLTQNQLSALPAAIDQLTSLQYLFLADNQLSSLTEQLYVRIKNGSLYVDLVGNPWPDPAQLTPLAQDSLASYAYQGLPRSLRILCADYINKNPGPLAQQIATTLLPQELSREERETILRQECHWPQQASIVFFYGDIAFYLDRQLCTPQEVKQMLEELGEQQLYLVPKD